MILKLPISAIIVGYNEGHLLKNSLPRLSFCDEILYFDLGSSDNSIELAEMWGAQVILHEKVDSCEWIHEKYAKKTKYEWVLITDPDEVINIELIDQIISLFDRNAISKKIGAITAPWIFFFKNKRLKGTNWGGINRKILIINNKRFEFLPLIHVSRKLLNGFEQYDIPYEGHNYISHYWMSGYVKLFEKHLRYLRNEGLARHKTGRTATMRNIIKEPYKSFKYSFVVKHGYKDGIKGLFLSFFWAWYETSAQIRTLHYQKSAGRTTKK